MNKGTHDTELMNFLFSVKNFTQPTKQQLHHHHCRPTLCACFSYLAMRWLDTTNLSVVHIWSVQCWRGSFYCFWNNLIYIPCSSSYKCVLFWVQFFVVKRLQVSLLLSLFWSFVCLCVARVGSWSSSAIDRVGWKAKEKWRRIGGRRRSKSRTNVMT